MADEISQAQLEELAKIAQPIEAYTTNASSISIVWGGNDAMILFARPKPLMVPGHVQAPIARMEATATVHVSSATLKDFYLILKETIEKHEAINGEIITDYSRKIAQQK